ncbi:prosaposin [Belonocnema kinseyi]|uniref:prosaposin n=1 Tax=Belonocnema kinseyi TaxID=2817044 RepID=UPI00143DD544|nr:prosaposin [Belonocnema kinseyi]
MKAILIALCAILAVTTARVVIKAEGQDTPHVLGAKACTWGPSYWCQNITTAAGCKATKHCIQKEWEHMTVPKDTDSVCKICEDMVTQARDQLESNQTQEDLKSVFEGSCILIHIKPIVKECIKLVDEFIPELVETLASQMNPSVVCSVAGLCNSAHIDQLLLENKASVTDVKVDKKPFGDDELDPNDCSKCFTIATHMEQKFKKTSRDHFLEQLLHVCGQFSSFSDACSSIVLTNFETIYTHLQDNLKAENICHLSGQCSAQFHRHDDVKSIDVEIRPLSSVGMVEVSDDLPCKLCEQLVGHLRDLLVANTTETEFQTVLEGLCKQTKSFASECKSIVDEYYPEIYTYLTKGLNGIVVCSMAGICPSPGKSAFNGPIWPLLPETPKMIATRIMSEKKDLDHGASESLHSDSEAEQMQLPIQRIHTPFSSLAFPVMDVKGKTTCAFCEYVLHYVQQAITTPSTEAEVKQVIDKVCSKLPSSVKNTCEEFIDTYGDAVVAILAQEIDPATVCPMIHVCPTQEVMNLWEKIPSEMTLKTEVEDKPSCPLCLLAVTQIYNAIKNDKTEANIVNQLDKLCDHLPKSLNDQCYDLVKGYSKELIEMLIADLTPQEVCVYIKLCDPEKQVGPVNTFVLDKDGEIMTNEIPNFPLHPVIKKPVKDDTECVVCEFVMQYIEKAMSNKKTKDEVETIIHGVCNHLPKTISQECNQFVNQYADVVIDLLVQEVSPKEICTMIGLCSDSRLQIKESVAECALCQTVVSTIDKLLGDPKVDNNIEEIVSKVCKFLPASKQSKCTMIMEVYEQSIINILKKNGDPQKICSKIALCSSNDYLVMSESNHRVRRSQENIGMKKCTWGPSFWCADDINARECKTEKHCREKVWFAESAAAAKEMQKQSQSVK